MPALNVCVHWRLFCRAFSIVTVTSANVVMITHGRGWWMLATGTLLSWIWVANSRAIIRWDLPWTREAYAAGAGLGTVAGWWLAGRL